MAVAKVTNLIQQNPLVIFSMCWNIGCVECPVLGMLTHFKCHRCAQTVRKLKNQPGFKRSCKSTCPFCKKVKELFKSLGANAKIIEINQEKDGVELQKALVEITKQRTVPSVFIGGEHVGGCDATMEANNKGTLVPMLKQAGVLRDDHDQEIEGEVTTNEEGKVETAKEGPVQGELEA